MLKVAVASAALAATSAHAAEPNFADLMSAAQGEALRSIEPQPRTPEEKRQDHDQRFRESIAECKGMGVSVRVLNGIVVGADRQYIWAPEEQRIQASIAGTPLSALEGFASEARDMPKVFQNKHSTGIYPLSLETRTSDGLLRVRVYDHLVGDCPLSAEYGMGESERARKEIEKRVGSILDDRRAEHAKIVAGIPPNRSIKPLLELLPAPNGKSALAALGSAGVSLDITISNPRRTAEESVRLRLSPEQLLLAKDQALRCNGSVENVCLMQRSVKVAYDRENGTVNGGPLSTHTTDVQGNFVQTAWVTFLGVNDSADLVSSITPRTSFAETKTNLPQFAPISVNLAAFGIKESFVLAEQPIMAPVGKAGPYRVYGDLSHSKLAAAIEANLPAIEKGSSRIEGLFGFEAGEKLQRVVIIDSDYENGAYRLTTPHATFLNDEALIKASWAESMSRHETVHLIAHELDVDLNEGPVKKRYEQIQRTAPGFFSLIDESSFLNEEVIPDAGHSAGNSSELLASFVNGLSAESWEHRMETWASPTMTRADFFKEYLTTISAVREGVSLSQQVSKQAPIFELLDRRAAFIDKLLVEAKQP